MNQILIKYHKKLIREIKKSSNLMLIERREILRIEYIEIYKQINIYNIF